jgi:NAD(P)-dependent dehydrogenase (short-subunit alcohol dehydrogenase family)
MNGRLQDKVAIVIGAGSVGPGWGNGRAMAFRFAQEGARVWAVDRDMGHLEETLARVRDIGGTIEAHVCDATDSAAVAALVQACRAKWNRVDVLVNNVGGSAAGGPVEMSEEVFDAQVAHNLKSAFLGCKNALPVMVAQGAGVIVNIASTSGLRWTGAAQVAYAATKAGVIQMTRSIAVQYASKAFAPTRWCRGSCIRRWSKRGSRNSARAATSTHCCGSARRASRWVSWATAWILPTPPCSSLRMKRGSLPVPNWWLMAA